MNDYKFLKNAYKDNTRSSLIKEKFYPSSGCPAGKVCPQKYKSDSCKAGYYCSSNILLPQKCPNGFYCPENSKKPIPCPYERPISANLSTSIDDCESES
jgi:hypothetical protein